MNDFKLKVIEECKRVQQEKADLAKEAMDDLQQQANEYGCPRDRYDAFRAQLLRKRDLFAVQYQRALNDLQILDRVDSKLELAKVGFGSIVETNMQTLFIAIGIGKINVESQELFVLSAKVPIFSAIEGLSVGDEYMFNNKKFQIRSVL